MRLSPVLVIPRALRRCEPLPAHVHVYAVCICGRWKVETRSPSLLLPLACDDPTCQALHSKFTRAAN